MYNFSSEIIFGQLLETFGDFYLVTLVTWNRCMSNATMTYEPLEACQCMRDAHISLWQSMDQSRPLFRLFSSFHITNQLQIEKSVDGVLAIWTWGCRMVGADKTIELWRPPAHISLWQSMEWFNHNSALISGPLVNTFLLFFLLHPLWFGRIKNSLDYLRFQ